MKTSRRIFIGRAAMASAALTVAQFAHSQGAVLQESDPQAVALGYRADATKVDKARYANYAPGQTCANCSLYQAKPGAAAGGCSLFGSKQVAAAAWCSAWARKG